MMLQKIILILRNTEIRLGFWLAELALNMLAQLEPYCNYIDTLVNYPLGTAAENVRECESNIFLVFALWSFS